MLGMAAMADAFLEMQSHSTAADLAREDWLGLLLDREATARDNKRLGRRLSHAVASKRRGRGHRLPYAAWPGPGAVPQARKLRPDPSQPAFADRRPDRCRDMMQYFTILLVLQGFLSGFVWDCTTV
jgi:hypothetical protein